MEVDLPSYLYVSGGGAVHTVTKRRCIIHSVNSSNETASVRFKGERFQEVVQLSCLIPDAARITYGGREEFVPMAEEAREAYRRLADAKVSPAAAPARSALLDRFREMIDEGSIEVFAPVIRPRYDPPSVQRQARMVEGGPKPGETVYQCRPTRPFNDFVERYVNIRHGEPMRFEFKGRPADFARNDFTMFPEETINALKEAPAVTIPQKPHHHAARKKVLGVLSKALDARKKVTVVNTDIDSTGPLGGVSSRIELFIEIDGALVPVAVNIYADTLIDERVKTKIEDQIAARVVEEDTQALYAEFIDDFVDS